MPPIYVLEAFWPLELELNWNSSWNACYTCVCKHPPSPCTCDVTMSRRHYHDYDDNCNSLRFTLYKLSISENVPCRSHRCPADNNTELNASGRKNTSSLYSQHRVIQPTGLIQPFPLHWLSMLKATLKSTPCRILQKIMAYFLVELSGGDCTWAC